MRILGCDILWVIWTEWNAGIEADTLNFDGYCLGEAEKVGIYGAYWGSQANTGTAFPKLVGFCLAVEE